MLWIDIIFPRAANFDEIMTMCLILISITIGIMHANLVFHTPVSRDIFLKNSELVSHYFPRIPLYGGTSSLVHLAKINNFDVDIVRVSYKYDKVQGEFIRIVHPYSKTYVTKSPVLSQYDQLLLKRHKFLVISFGGLSWERVSSGAYDSKFTSVFNKISTLLKVNEGSILFISFSHEPSSFREGNSKEFVDAWRHVYLLSEDLGYNYADGGPFVWTWITTASSTYSRAGKVPGFASEGDAKKIMADVIWPGDKFVDVVGFDGYNDVGCRVGRVDIKTKWRWPEGVFGEAIEWAKRYHPNKPIIIAEWGTLAGNGVRNRSNYIRRMGRFLNGKHNIIAALYWDYKGSGSCDFRINRDGTAVKVIRNIYSH